MFHRTETLAAPSQPVMTSNMDANQPLLCYVPEIEGLFVTTA